MFRCFSALAALALACSLAPGPAAGDAPLPDPLTLGQALALAGGHPRVQVAPERATRFPRRNPLYLDCHPLAFSSAAADPGRGSPATGLLDPTGAQALEILERYFDVLLADLAFSRYDEAMAVAYIQYDRAKVRSELGQISQLRVLELDAVYQDVLQNRAAAEIGQQLNRALLAQALNRPETLPRNLLAPALAAIPDGLPGVEDLVAQGLADNPAVKVLTEDGPEADRRLVALELRQQVLELLLRLRALGATEREVRAESVYRDLKLDESRTLYEQEVTADLGYSMSQQTMTRMQETRVAFCRALAWAELNALTGRPVWPMTEPKP